MEISIAWVKNHYEIVIWDGIIGSDPVWAFSRKDAEAKANELAQKHNARIAKWHYNV